eukprot:1150913-Pelagomonas_calceolata.AAC.7
MFSGCTLATSGLPEAMLPKYHYFFWAPRGLNNIVEGLARQQNEHTAYRCYSNQACMHLQRAASVLFVHSLSQYM